MKLERTKATGRSRVPGLHQSPGLRLSPAKHVSRDPTQQFKQHSPTGKTSIVTSLHRGHPGRLWHPVAHYDQLIQTQYLRNENRPQ